MWLGLFNFCTWILLDLPEEYKALFISFVSFFYYIYLFVIGFPVAQMVEHGASNAKIMGSIPRESKSW